MKDWKGINFKVIIKVIGFLLMIEGVFMFAGLPFSIYYGEHENETKCSKISNYSTFSHLLRSLFVWSNHRLFFISLWSHSLTRLFQMRGNQQAHGVRSLFVNALQTTQSCR